MHTPSDAFITKFLTAIALCALAFPALPAAAAEVPHAWQHDDGKIAGALKPSGQYPPVGTIMGIRFRPEHPFKLQKVEVLLNGLSGRKARLHVWRDNGGLQPGAPEGWYTNKPGADLITPKTVFVDSQTEVQTIDMKSYNLQLPAVEPFWVGIEVVELGATLGIDAIEEKKATITSLWQTKSGDCKDGCGVPADFIVRASGVYVDPIAAEDRWFSDITEKSGLKPGGRMAWADYDNDGDLDCLVSGRNLFNNDGKGNFTAVTDSGLETIAGDKGLWADVDNDGVLDVLTFGGEEAILRGIPTATGGHSGKFEVYATFAEAPDGTRWPTEAAVWFDVDNDGLLDVYFATYEQALSVCERDFLWRNLGGGKFEDVSEKFGVLGFGKQCGRGITATDWDQDGDVDLYVGNYRLDPNFFFRSEWPATWMTNIAQENKTIGTNINNAYGHAIGPSFVDADSDGDFDLFVPNLAHPRFITFSDRSLLYQNHGKAKHWEFSEHRAASGITYQETNSDGRWGDFDNDGFPDLAITNVYKGRKGRVWRNKGPGGDWLTFEDVTYKSGIIIDNGWGSAWPDIDGDGDLDYVANRLLRNDYAEKTGKSGHWLKVKLRGDGKVNRAAIGAWVVAALANGRRVTRHVSGGDGLSGQSGLTMHFGLGTLDTVASLEIHWPGGKTETLKDVKADQALVLDFGWVGKEKPADEADAGATGDASSDRTGNDASAADGGAGGSSTSSRNPDDGGCAASRSSGSTQGWWLLFAMCALIPLSRRKSERGETLT